MKKLFILFTTIFIFTLHAGTVLFYDDFNTSIRDEWSVGSSWTHDAKNGRLKCEGKSSIALSTPYTDFNISFTMVLSKNTSSFLLNTMRGIERRYYFGINQSGFFIHQQAPNNVFNQLTPFIEYDENTNGLDLYVSHNVSIVHTEDKLELYINNQKMHTYTDSNLSGLSGSIDIESTQSNNLLFIDDFQISSNKELTLSSTKWTSLGGPIGGIGYDLGVDSKNTNIMYVTDNSAGVSKSLNRGKTWKQKNKGINIKGGATGDKINIFSLSVDPTNPNILWAGTNGSEEAFGVFKSVDGAENWVRLTNGIFLKNAETGLTIRGFTIDPKNSNTVYVQTEVQTEVRTQEQGKEFSKSKGRVYKTLDGGNNWSEVIEVQSLTRYLIIDHNNSNILYLSTGLFDVEAINSTCEDGTQTALQRGGTGVYKSIDAGQTWKQVNSGLDDLFVGSLRMDPKNSQILFAGTGNNACSTSNTRGLYKTINGAMSWSKVIAQKTISAVNFSQQNPNIMYAGSAEGFFASQDKGNTWVKHTSNDFDFSFGPPGIHAGFPIDLIVDTNDSNTVYINNYGGGVIKSKDGGKSWKSWSKGISGAIIHSIHTNHNAPNKLYVIGRSGPYLSQNFGDTFKGINKTLFIGEGANIITHPENDSIIFTSDALDKKLLKSTDNGKTFALVLTHTFQGDSDTVANRYAFKAMAFAPTNSNKMLVGIASSVRFTTNLRATKGNVLYISNDGGSTFTPIVSEINTHSVNDIAFSKTDPTHFLVATTNGVYTTTDNAKSFTNTLPTKWIESIIIDVNNTIIVSAVHEGIYTSHDFGTSWSGPSTNGFSSPTPYITAIIADDLNSSILYASDYYSGVYKSVDTGSSWQGYPDYKMSGLKNRSVTALASVGGLLYAGTDGAGVFRFGNPKQILKDAKKTSLDLNIGWNFKAVTTNTNLSMSDLNTTLIVWHYKNSAWYAYSQTFANEINNNSSIGTLNTLEPGDGFWAYSKEDTALILDLNSTYTLLNHPKLSIVSQGWSMLGIAQTTLATDILNTNSNIKTIWTYEDGIWSALGKTNTLNTDLTQANINTLQKLNAGEAFWINVK